MESDDPRKKNKEYWTYLEENYREVSGWPSWMRGEGSLLLNKCTSQSEEPGYEEGEPEGEAQTKSRASKEEA
jgi:hypothetical protein